MKMRRLLLVSPHFPPTNAADHQRVRMALPFLRDLGWAPEVIAVAPTSVAAPTDPFLERTIPADVPVERVRGLSAGWRILPGLGSVAQRCGFALRRALHRRLRAGPLDGTVVYFSTTQFLVHAMIPELKRRFPVTVAIDYQDPWVNDYYARHPDVMPPGGRLKYGIVYRLARRHERTVAPHVDGFTAVSSRYAEDFRQRYPALAAKPFLVLPFGAAESDFSALARSDVRQRQFDPADGHQHWVYVGRGGTDMAFSLRAFFRAFRLALERDEQIRRVRLQFIGTDYAPAERARPSITPLARECGVGEWVEESPARIGYGETLRCLLDAQALIVPGSDDPGYTASKLYPYVLARKPMLTIFHRDSSVNRIVADTGCARAVTFDGTTTCEALAGSIDEAWFAARSYLEPVVTNWKAFAPYSAETMTRRLSTFLGELPAARDHI